MYNEEILQPTLRSLRRLMNIFMKTLNMAGERQLPCLTPLQAANLADKALLRLLTAMKEHQSLQYVGYQ